jgi:regulator of sigma E protease
MTIIYFILILGITIFVHELGHFIFAKKAGVHVFEFSLGMGPKLWSFKRKNDETEYFIRLFPIGGYVAMAGETTDEKEDVKKDKWLINKSLKERFQVMIAGVTMNFVLAFIIFVIIAFFIEVPTNDIYVYKAEEGFDAYYYLKENDKIVKVNNKSIFSEEHLMLELLLNNGKEIDLTVERDGNLETFNIKPTETEDGYKYGFQMTKHENNSMFKHIKFAFNKIVALVHQMILTIGYLITGRLSTANLAGPIGIFNIVGETAKAGLLNIVYLLGFLSVNVGFINLLPIPAFDGGHILFLLIEYLKGSPVDRKLETKIHNIGFILLMILMLYITYNDIIRIFN